MSLSAGLQADVVVCGSVWEDISFLVVLEEGGDGAGSYLGTPICYAITSYQGRRTSDHPENTPWEKEIQIKYVLPSCMFTDEI